jgi:hypothetical protein
MQWQTMASLENISRAFKHQVMATGSNHRALLLTHGFLPPDKGYHKWLHYIMWALPTKTARFTGPDKFADAVRYFDLMKECFQQPSFVIGSHLQSQEFCGGFVIVRKATNADAKGGKQPQYVVEFPMCFGADGVPKKVSHHSAGHSELWFIADGCSIPQCRQDSHSLAHSLTHSFIR